MSSETKKGLLALSPIVAMIVLIVLNGFIYGGVSNAPLLFIFVLSAMAGIALTKGVSFRERAAVSLAEKSRKHPGCIAYDVFVSTTRSDVFMVCDTWKDKESHDQHAATPEFQHYCKIMNECGHFKIEEFEF